jgi:hypothetical protein
VFDRFVVLDKLNGKGCHLPGAFTLVPRQFIKLVLKETKTFFDPIAKILDQTNNSDPLSDHKVPVYDDRTPATYFTCGQSAQQFGKGISEVS